MDLARWIHAVRSVLYELLVVRPEDVASIFSFLLESTVVLCGASLDGGKVAWNLIRKISPRGALLCVGWFVGYKAALAMGLGTLYAMATIFVLMLTNFETRKPGDLSAYNVFNRNFERLPGTLDAEQLDAEIRHQVRWNEGEEEPGDEADQEEVEEADSQARHYWKEKKKQVREMYKSEHDEAEAANRQADEEFRQRLVERRKILIARLASQTG